MANADVNLNDTEIASAFLPGEIATNILINPADEYASSTYRLTFSMLPYSYYTTQEVNLDLKGGSRIIIAQTGVTKFQIEDLEISSVTTGSPPNNLKGNTTSSYIMNFTLKEPYGMSFVDLLNRTVVELAKKDKGIEFPGKPSLQEMPYLMEIELIGQKDPISKEKEPEKLDLGEVYYHTAIPIRLVNFNAQPGVEGTGYQMVAVTINEIYKSADRSVSVVPKDLKITSENGTVEELLEDFTKEMQKQQVAIATGKSLKTEGGKATAPQLGVYELSSEGLPENPDIFKDGLPVDEEYKSGPIHLKDIKDFKDKTIEGTKADDLSGKGDPADDGQNNSITVNIPKDTTVENVIKDLASLNTAYCKLAHRYETGDNDVVVDPDKCNLDKVNVVIPEVKKSSEWTNGKFTADGKISYEFKYTLTGKLSSGIVCTPKELAESNDKARSTKAAKDRNISKFYGYYYTGMNDQVYDIDLTIDNMVRYLQPGFGGKQSSYSASEAAQLSSKGIATVEKSIENDLTETKNVILDKFERIGKELKNVVTQLAELPITLTTDLQSLATGLNPIEGVTTDEVTGTRIVNLRMPSSPIAILQKGKTITELTTDLNNLTNSIDDLQDSIQGELSELLDSQISNIMSKAFTPFDVLDSLGNKIGEGINGMIGAVEGVVGEIGLDQFGINTNDLLDPAKDIIKKEFPFVNFDENGETGGDESSGSTPPGFNPGTVSTSATVDLEGVYMEEFEYLSDDNSPEEIDKMFGEFDTGYGERELIGPCTSKFVNRSLFSMMLTNSELGTPYLKKMNMTIKGDPYWLGKSKIKGNTFSQKPKVEYLGDDEADLKSVLEESQTDNVAPYGIGDVTFLFAYLFPREYDTWHDDPSRHTGEMKDLKLDQSFSGQFAVYRVVHNFSGGVFRQNIEAVRLEFQGQFPELSLKDQESRDAKAEIARQLGQTVPDGLGIGNQNNTDFGLLPENLNIDVSNVTAGIGDT
jgi:hypothetical protein|tara:strand:+ start:4058 stop:6997 length:2940 start_codon:yes stop_codon:yes gene_type:complete